MDSFLYLFYFIAYLNDPQCKYFRLIQYWACYPIRSLRSLLLHYYFLQNPECCRTRNFGRYRPDLFAFFASVEPSAAALIRAAFKSSNLSVLDFSKKKTHTIRCAFLFGGTGQI